LKRDSYTYDGSDFIIPEYYYIGFAKSPTDTNKCCWCISPDISEFNNKNVYLQAIKSVVWSYTQYDVNSITSMSFVSPKDEFNSGGVNVRRNYGDPRYNDINYYKYSYTSS
jgi:hypothetical protein